MGEVFLPAGAVVPMLGPGPVRSALLAKVAASPPAAAPARAGCGGWSLWSGPGHVIGSWHKPTRFSAPEVLGGCWFAVPSSPRARAAGAPVFRARAGWPGRRARAFRFSVSRLIGGVPVGPPVFLWVIWEGRGGAPRRRSVGRWLAGVGRSRFAVLGSLA